MKRWTSLLLSILLLGSLGVPAMAAGETADTRLAKVTEAVKKTLDLDTDAYTEFRGDVSEEALGTVWSLYWSGSGSSLSVEALEDGTVVNYWRSDSDEGVYYGNSLPAFPKVDAAAAQKAAEAFLGKVLDAKTESVVLEDPAAANQLGSTSCRFSGKILLSGLASPMNYSITVRGSDNAVTSFYRDAPSNLFLGGVPSATPAVTKDAAAKTLRETLKLELIYVVSEDDTAKAVLRYVPKDQETYYVDAQTGKLVTPGDDIVTYMNGSGAAETPGASLSAMDGGLTAAEQAGVEKLEGVLDRDALDALVRKESAYKLDGYTVSSSSYRLVKEGEIETVLCTLRYVTSDEDYATARVFTVEARTGAVRSLASNGRWDENRTPAVKAADARKTAEAFLSRFTDKSAEFALYDTDDRTAEGAPSYGFTFARKANGYFYPANSCVIRIDCESGAVCGVSFAYDEAVAFDTADGLVTEAAALDAWMDTYDAVLAYRLLPKELSANVADEARLIEIGITRFYSLFLSYALERETYSPGVDAKTGKPVRLAQSDGGITYGDVAGKWAAKEIETLARYGIGYAGGAFNLNKALTQWDFVCLLASTRGLVFDPANATAEERDSAYNTVYRMGALTRAERKDDAAVTRGGLVKLLLNSAGYGPVAKLTGVYTCSYTDRASIPDADLGYAALAQGFGLVTDTAYAPDKTATRAVAAVMLYRLLEREV